MQEQFIDIPGYEGYYQVSNLGKVRKLDRYEEMKCKGGGNAKRFRKGGEVYITKSKRKNTTYLGICLWKDGKVKYIGLHRLVAMCFIPNLDNKLEVNHIDGNAENNSIDNLEWCTRSENELHKYRVLGISKVWNKGKKLSETRPDIYTKMWDTRRNNLLSNHI